jgi:predicted ferric reductase
MDPRLKKRHGGPLLVAVGGVVIYLAWDWLRPAAVDPLYFAGEFPGVAAAYLMSWTLVLATRVPWLEQWFGGLDRMYLWHRRYALLSMALLVPHILLHLLLAGRAYKDTDAHESGRLVMEGHLLGAGSAIVLLALVIVSLGQVSRIVRLPYERWLFLHRLTGLLLLTSLIHGWLLDLIIAGSRPLLAIYVSMGLVGMAAYGYDELVLRRREPRADYTVARVSRPTPDVIDITLAPTGTKHLRLNGGEFVYLRAGGHRAWREHPFSVAGVNADGMVRLTIRALGRDTRRLQADVREGLPATVSGPYGMFDHTLGGNRQIWIAGGIGVAPFLGWLSQPRGALPRTDLFYCAPDAEAAPFLPELLTATEELPRLRVHPTFSRADGRLTAERIREVAGPLTPDLHVFLCGPAPMLEDLSRALHRHGIPREHVHAEHFTFR